MSDEVLRWKLARLLAGERPRVLDLFAGCGGISLGFHYAGCKIVGAVEENAAAARTHAQNFFKGCSDDERLAHSLPRDITVTTPDELAHDLSLGRTELAVDIIVGGPPCQAFARIGRAKLREVAAARDAFRTDKRSRLYLHYIEYVREFKPLALLLENVPDMLNFGERNVPHEICETLTEMGYLCRYTLLNAAHYGVPQMRERLFLLAYSQEVGVFPVFPPPTHWIELPKGYENSRQVALGLASRVAANDRYFTPPPMPDSTLPPAVTAGEALGDLPPITYHLEGGSPLGGARRFTTLATYRTSPEASTYAWKMRNWPGFESPEGVWDHITRSLPRDYELFRRMAPGDQYPDAHRHALQLLQERIAEHEAKTGKPVTQGSEDYLRILRATVPPYDPSKFPNKWRKLEADKPARTLTAHLGKDTYSHIHYDSDQARTITVREAARLQSFPDGFTFQGGMNAAFRQIGNAVPPLLAAAIARQICAQLMEPATPNAISSFPNFCLGVS